MRLLAFLLLLLPMSVTNAKQPLIIGHRGASHAAPENTLAAFKLAWKEGADGIEGDFHLTSDGQVVCTHDADTRRVAGKNLRVADSTLAQLQALDVGSWKHPKFRKERMPTLADVLATVPKGKKMFIEIKSGPQTVAPMIEICRQSDVPLEDIVVISFRQAVISECHRQLPELKTHWLTDYKKGEDKSLRPTADAVVKALRKINAHGLGSKAVTRHVDAQFIETLREAGFEEYHVWTVDSVKEARMYRDLGAYSITTNRPGWLRQQLEESK